MYELRSDNVAALDAKAEAVAALETLGDSVWLSIIPEEEEAMPAHTVSAGQDVPCGNAAYVRLDGSPQPGRTMIAIMNPDQSANRLGVVVSNSDTIPTPSTVPTYVIEPDYGVNPGPLAYADANVRHYGKSLGTGTITARVTQGGA